MAIATPILNTSTGGLTKSGPGTLILSASNGYSGQTTVNRGKLLVNGSETSPVNVGVDATLGGFGSVGAISGAGTVSPGANAGILTAPSIDPSQNLGFRFEINQAAPNFANAANSGNDVLRLTGPNPFGLGLSLTNKILFDFQMPVLTNGMAFIGGFFTDSNTDYAELIRGAAIVATLNGGPVPDGLGVLFDQMVPETVDFGAGPVVGRALQVRIVPEPGTVGLLAVGALGLLRRGRRIGE